MLVAAFKVHINRPCQFRAYFGNSCMRRTAVKPNVHNVAFFGKVFAAAVRAGGAFRQNFFCFVFPPCVGTFFLEQIGNGVNGFVGNHRFAAFFAVERRNRNAPYALTRNAPVVAVGNHVMDTAFAPGRNPFNFVGNGSKRIITETVDRCEPLLGCAVNNRVFAAPAVCVLMADVFLAEQHAEFSKVF